MLLKESSEGILHAKDGLVLHLNVFICGLYMRGSLWLTTLPLCRLVRVEYDDRFRVGFDDVQERNLELGVRFALLDQEVLGLVTQRGVQTQRVCKCVLYFSDALFHNL